jgi:hypothetical protein
MATLGSQAVPEFLADEKEHRRQIARALNFTKKGKINVTFDVTLNANATTTVISDPRLSIDSAISPAMAMTANGATAIAAGIYVDTVLPPVGTTNASATVHHASNAATDQKIRFLIIG